jgi:hypothetical protein
MGFPAMSAYGKGILASNLLLLPLLKSYYCARDSEKQVHLKPSVKTIQFPTKQLPSSI